MEFRTEGLEIKLLPFRPFDQEDWTQVQVEVRVNGFQGAFISYLQLADLIRFTQELRQMEEALVQGSHAELSSAEPGVFLKFIMGSRGEILGEYQFESERRDGVPTLLSGSCELDQSYLPELRKQVHILVAQLSSKISL